MHTPSPHRISQHSNMEAETYRLQLILLFQLPNLIQHLLHHFLVLYYVIQVVGIEHIIPKNLVDGEED